MNSPRITSTAISRSFGRSWERVYSFLILLLGLPGPTHTILTFFGRCWKLQRNRGWKGLGVYLKECQRLTLLVLANKGTKSPTVRTWKGLPAIIPRAIARGILDGQPSYIRLALVLLGYARSIRYKGIASFSTITQPGSHEPVGVLRPEVMRALRNLRVARFRADQEVPQPFEVSNRSGPNGHATLSAHWDAYELRRSSLWEPFQRIASLSGLGSVLTTVERLSSVVETTFAHASRYLEFLPEGRPVLGRLALKEEPLGKVRVFALGDYFSQTVLRPFHNFLMKELRKLPMDGTWDQGLAADRVREATAMEGELSSFDLSAATDRFPVDFQILVIEVLTGSDFATAWRKLLTDRDFWLKGRRYRYAVGQPMGMLSSWAAFAVSHHVTVQIAALRAGHVGLFEGYSLLGDDIVIFDRVVANEYLKLMDQLAVPINLDKSVIGSQVAEFAKRHFYQGHEVTGVSGTLVTVALKNLSGMRMLVETAVRRGYEISPLSYLMAALFQATNLNQRCWRYLLISLLGPGGPLGVQPELWGGLCTVSYEDLIDQLTGVSAQFSRLPPLHLSPENPSNILGPLGEGADLAIEILRHWSIRSIRKARESHSQMMENLVGSLDTLIRGWVLTLVGRDGGGGQTIERDNTVDGNIFGRALREAGHPAWAIDPHLDAPETESTEWELFDLNHQLRKGDHPSRMVTGLLPSADSEYLVRASQDSRLAMQVCRTVAVSVALAFEWQEPGALEMIREGLTLEIGEIPLGSD